MMRRRSARLYCGALAGALLAGHAMMARAAPRPPSVVSLPATVVAAGAVALTGDESAKRIIEAVQKRNNAKVVKVTDITVDGRHAYELKLLSEQGRVWTIRVDAESGRELPRQD
jgi:hypothetical protein